LHLFPYLLQAIQCYYFAKTHSDLLPSAVGEAVLEVVGLAVAENEQTYMLATKAFTYYI